MMPAKDLTNLSSEAEKYLRLLQNPKVNTADLSASLQCAQRLCKAVATGAEAALWFMRTARLLRPLLLQLLFVPLYTVFLGIIARSLQSISIIILHFDSQLQALRSQMKHISSINRRHGPLVDTVADSLAYEDSTRDIISDLRSVYSQSKTQIHVQPSAVKTRERNDGMSEVLPPHTVGIIATTNVSAMEPAVVSHTRSVSGYNDGIDLLNNSLLSTELGLSTFPRSKILSSNMSPMVSSSFFSNTLEACTTTRNPLGKDSLLGIPSSSFSPRSMGSDLFSTRQTSSEKHALTPVYHSDFHFLNSETKSAKVSAKNQDELKGENAISEDVVMMGALSNPTCVNGRSGIEEDYGEIVSASIEVVLNKSNGSTNLKKRSHTGFDPSLITSLDRTESVKRLSIESGDVIALGNSGINTSSGIEPHSSHTSSEGLDITSATDSNSKSKLRSKTDNNLLEGEEKSSDTFHKLPIIKKRRRLRKPKNGAERDTIDDIFRNYL